MAAGRGRRDRRFGAGRLLGLALARRRRRRCDRMDVHLAVAVLRVAVGRDARREAERLRPLGETADHGAAGAGDDAWELG